MRMNMRMNDFFTYNWFSAFVPIGRRKFNLVSKPKITVNDNDNSNENGDDDKCGEDDDNNNDDDNSNAGSVVVIRDS